MEVCKRCLMDSTAEGFKLIGGKCNFCKEFENILDNQKKHTSQLFAKSIY